MPWLLGLIAALLVFLGLRPQLDKRRRARGCKPEKEKKKKERVVLAVERGGAKGIRLAEEAPSTIRARQGSEVHWLVDVVSTDGREHKLGIQKFFEGTTEKRAEEVFRDPDLSVKIPSGSGAAVYRIKGELNSRLPSGLYTYRIYIDDTPAEAKGDKSDSRSSEDGEMYACPVWPCDEM